MRSVVFFAALSLAGAASAADILVTKAGPATISEACDQDPGVDLADVAVDVPRLVPEKAESRPKAVLPEACSFRKLGFSPGIGMWNPTR